MRLQPAAGWRSLLYSTLLLTGAWAKKDKPSVKSTKFAFIPYNVNYFDDSDVLLFEDGISHNVYRSDNAGEDWSVVDGVPEGKLLELAMHPFDKKRAYIITNEKTHYKTDDRGETWEEFEADAQASIFRQALMFHGGDPDRIILNAMDCAGIFCEELVSLPAVCEAWLTLVDDVYYRRLLGKGQVLEKRYCWLPLGEVKHVI